MVSKATVSWYNCKLVTLPPPCTHLKGMVHSPSMGRSRSRKALPKSITLTRKLLGSLLEMATLLGFRSPWTRPIDLSFRSATHNCKGKGRKRLEHVLIWSDEAEVMSTKTVLRFDRLSGFDSLIVLVLNSASHLWADVKDSVILKLSLADLQCALVNDCA